MELHPVILLLSLQGKIEEKRKERRKNEIKKH
jgi:hypothetical protein